MSEAMTPLKVFCCYAHADTSLLHELKAHLAGLERQKLISTWYDRQVLAGTDRQQAIDSHLGAASLILLLVSSDFLASDYCYGIEMKRALERCEAKEAHVIPILLSGQCR